MKTGDRIQLEIIDYDHTGKGLGKVDGAVVFTDGGFIGDRVLIEIRKAKKRFFQGEILEYVKKTPNRVKNPCPYGKICGGCSFLAWDYKKELEWKESRVQDALERIAGLDIPVEEIVAMENPYGYRNHMQFHQQGGYFGLYDKKAKGIIPIQSCLMQGEKANAFLEGLKGQAYLRDFTTLGLRSNKKDELMAIFVSDKDLKESTKHKIVALAIDYGIDSLYFSHNTNPRFHYGKEFTHLYGKKILKEELGSYSYQISPSSFFQVNRTQAEKLIHMVKESLRDKGWDVILDLFCGIGTLSLPLSEVAKQVIGVEMNPGAIDDARVIAKDNGKDNLRYIAGRVENILPRLVEEEGLKPKALVLDPPRSGAEEETLKTILEILPEKITYVSCNPSTLARDLKVLGQKYRVEKVTPIDMFPRTAHVECIALLRRVKG